MEMEMDIYIKYKYRLKYYIKNNIFLRIKII